MSSYTETFKRKEIKYVLNKEQCEYIQEILRTRGGMEPDAYGTNRVTSLYLDTADREMIRRSIEKPMYKEKLRLRWYGELSTDDTIFYELKKKFNGIVYKRRISGDINMIQAFLGGTPYEVAWAQSHEALNNPVATSNTTSVLNAQELQQVMKRYDPLYQSMLITVMRTAYTPSIVDADDASNDLRITFDGNVSYADLMDSNAASVMPLLPEDHTIMEVKVLGAYPLWLSHALSECSAYPTSYSKYGTAYIECLNKHYGDNFQLLEPVNFVTATELLPAVVTMNERITV